MKKQLSLILSFLPFMAFAQQMNVKDVDFSAMMFTVFPFYALVIAALALFINKLMRPTAKLWPLVVLCLVGIVYAYFVTQDFKEIQNTQLGGNEIAEALKDENINEDFRKDLAFKQYEQNSFWTGSFFTTSMPAFSLLVLGVVVHVIQKKRKEEEEA